MTISLPYPKLTHSFIGDRTGTCILALLPETPDDTGAKAIISLSEVQHKYKLLSRNLFPFYVLSSTNPGYAKVKSALKLAEGESQIIAINGKRGWWRQISESALAEKDITQEAIENFVDAIRLGEGAKQKLPAGLIPEEVEEPAKSGEAPKAEESPIIVEEVKEGHDEL